MTKAGGGERDDSRPSSRSLADVGPADPDRLLPGVARNPAPMPMQRLIFWLASVLIAAILLVVFAIAYIALSESDSASGMIALMAICVALTSPPLLVWNPSWAARVGGVLTLLLALLLLAVALFGT